MKQIENIQYITQDNNQLSHEEQALLMFKNGIKWVQLRMKNKNANAIIKTATTIQAAAEKYNSTLIINDSVEIAKKVNAKAVHLGLQDMPINEARAVLGNNVIIGGTANTLDDILLQADRGADYVGVGPFRFTSTKKNLSPVLGLQGYKTIATALKKQNITIPVFAVGGIKLTDIPEIKAAGISRQAISTDLLECILYNYSIKPYL